MVSMKYIANNSKTHDHDEKITSHISQSINNTR